MSTVQLFLMTHCATHRSKEFISQLQSQTFRHFRSSFQPYNPLVTVMLGRFMTMMDLKGTTSTQQQQNSTEQHLWRQQLVQLRPLHGGKSNHNCNNYTPLLQSDSWTANEANDRRDGTESEKKKKEREKWAVRTTRRNLSQNKNRRGGKMAAKDLIWIYGSKYQVTNKIDILLYCQILC